MTNQQDTALLPVAWLYERNDGQHRFVSMDRRGIILGEGPLGYTETPLFAAHRLQAKPSASCEGEEVERVARAIDPIEWKTIDHWWPYRGTANYDDRIDDMRARSMDRARAAIAALSERGAVGEEVEYLNKVESFGASFSREDDSWHVYTMEAGRIEPDFCIVPGYETAKIDRVLGILRYARAAIAALRANAPEAQRYRHKKRGTEYDVLGFAEFQSNEYYEPAEGEFLVVYRGDDGKLWARGKSEFYDGRFECIRSGAGDDLGAGGKG